MTVKIVSITGMVPYDAVPHAGGRYVAAVYAAMRRAGASLTVIGRDTPSSREARRRAGCPERLVLAGDGPRPAWSRLPSALSGGLLRTLGRVRQLVTDVELGAELWCQPRMRQALREADVVDMQWEISGRLLPFVRALAPGATTVVTFHDVDSQRWERKAAGAQGLKRLLLHGVVRHVQRGERRIGRGADRCAVLSDKDAALLRRVGVAPEKIVTVDPVIDMTQARARRAPQPGVVLMVSFLARHENCEGARWFLRHVWPAVRREHPEAVLRLVGQGAPAELVEEVREVPGAQMLGFVEDLQGQYAQAAVCVVPLFEGAGVKFKTLEALLAGVPVVTTDVGAEGIGGEELFAALTGDPRAFAAAVSAALAEVQEPAPAETPLLHRALRSADALTSTYSTGAFHSTLRRLYGLPRQGQSRGSRVQAPGEAGR